MNIAVSKGPIRELTVQLPRKLGFLLEMHPYKVAYGGRFGLKTRSACNAILSLGANQKLRILCCREIMNSIKDSVHQEMKDQIEARGLGSFYTVLENEIRGRNGTVIIYSGLAGHSVESIKSFANIDICLVEEAQTVKKRSWDILIPTIRAENSEIWVLFNPDMDTDDTWVRWIVHPPKGTVSVKMGWQDAEKCGWFPANENEKRLHCQKYQPDDYDNIWEGMPRTVVVGAIYAREVLAMIEEKRIRPTPYDPRLPVDTIWDLGWNDAMTIIMVQKPSPSALNIINYREDSFRRYDEYVADLNKLNYRWGTDWLPHDGANKDPKTGKSTKDWLKVLGRTKVKVIGERPDGTVAGALGVEEGIKAARMMFPRIYLDDTERKADSGHLGCARLIECLKRYRRNVPTTTGEPSTPVHDEFSHGADAFRYLSQIVDQIRTEEPPAFVPIPGFSNHEPSMGMLG